MKNNQQEPVQIVLTYNTNNSESSLRTRLVPTDEKAESKLKKLDDNHKLMRRYSFDDNGGGYLGL